MPNELDDIPDASTKFQEIKKTEYETLFELISKEISIKIKESKKEMIVYQYKSEIPIPTNTILLSVADDIIKILFKKGYKCTLTMIENNLSFNINCSKK
jgi:hypothetical protein